MMWLNIALVAAILCQCSCEDVDCNNMFPDTLYGQVECIQEETESENEEVTSCDIVDARNITWTVVNTKSGTVAVEFNLMPRSCGFELYRLDLFVDEKVTNAGECDSETDFQSLHSTRYMKILKTEAGNKTEVSSCGRTAAVKFNYIFSGCYLLEIGRIHDSVASMRMFIETEYKKVLLTQKIPRITNQYTTALQQIDVSVQFESVEEIEDLHMGFRLISDIDQTKDRACYVSGHEHSCCTYRVRGSNLHKLCVIGPLHLCLCVLSYCHGVTKFAFGHDINMRYAVLMVASMKITVFWLVATCSLAEVY